MTTLKDYLATLNSSETQWGIWVNPENLDDFRIGQDCFENGGFDDGKVCIGSLEELSFGFQSRGDALEELLRYNQIEFRNVTFSKKNCDFEAFKEAYFEEKLAPELQKICDKLIDELCQEWAENEADLKIEELENYFAESGEYWQELKELELAYA